MLHEGRGDTPVEARRRVDAPVLGASPAQSQDRAVIHDPKRHEAPSAAGWEAELAQRAAAAIACDARDRFDPHSFWPAHPLEGRGADASLYLGAAGVMWALGHLASSELEAAWNGQAPDLPAPAWWARHLAHAIEVDATLPGAARRASSWFLGEVGIRMAAWRAGLPGQEDAIAKRIAANHHNPARELFWGAPGTMLAATFLYEGIGDDRWRSLGRESAATLLAEWQPREGRSLWVQQLYGDVLSYLGGAHGFAGNVHALWRSRQLLDATERAHIAALASETAITTAHSEDDRTNWPAVLGERSSRLVQWCHGAPGMVSALAQLPPHAALDRLLLSAGELVFHAGPLRKGGGLCHGTAGNGYALLALHARTGDERWLDRARAFAMHAAAQVREAHETHGRGLYSLWTGDVGVALYLLDCVRAESGLPMLDVF
jgi:hypothetical protein